MASAEPATRPRAVMAAGAPGQAVSERSRRTPSRDYQRPAPEARQPSSEYGGTPSTFAPDYAEAARSLLDPRRRSISQRRPGSSDAVSKRPPLAAKVERRRTSVPTPPRAATPTYDLHPTSPDGSRTVSRTRLPSPLIAEAEAIVNEVRASSRQAHQKPAGLPRAPLPPGARQLPQKPATEVPPPRCEPKLEFFSNSMQGLRPYMEDRTLVVPSLPGHPGVSVFAVFDGHGGAEVAELATQLLPDILAEALTRCKFPDSALRECFAVLEKQLWDIHLSMETDQVFYRIGSTANVVLVVTRGGRTRLFCANCGDSRAVLSRAGVAVELSRDHAPQNPGEERRIEAAGGQVVICDTTGRVDGGLAVSRALGDFKYKARSDLAPEKQKVIAVPEVKEMVVGSLDDYVAIASDGVFSVLSSEELVGMLGFARKRGDSWEKAIQNVLEKTAPGGDNVCLCIAHFIH